MDVGNLMDFDSDSCIVTEKHDTVISSENSIGEIANVGSIPENPPSHCHSVRNNITVTAEQIAEWDREMELYQAGERQHGWEREMRVYDPAVRGEEGTAWEGELGFYEAAEADGETRLHHDVNTVNRVDISAGHTTEFETAMEFYEAAKSENAGVNAIVSAETVGGTSLRHGQDGEDDLIVTAELKTVLEMERHKAAVREDETCRFYDENAGINPAVSAEQNTELEKGIKLQNEREDETPLQHSENEAYNLAVAANQNIDLEKEMELYKVFETRVLCPETVGNSPAVSAEQYTEFGRKLELGDTVEGEDETHLLHNKKSRCDIAVSSDQTMELERENEHHEATERDDETDLLLAENSRNNLVVSAKQNAELQRDLELYGAAKRVDTTHLLHIENLMNNGVAGTNQDPEMERELELYGAAESLDRTHLLHVENSESNHFVLADHKTGLEREMELCNTVEREIDTHLLPGENCRNDIFVNPEQKVVLEREMEYYKAVEREDETCLLNGVDLGSNLTMSAVQKMKLETEIVLHDTAKNEDGTHSHCDGNSGDKIAVNEEQITEIGREIENYEVAKREGKIVWHHGENYGNNLTVLRSDQQTELDGKLRLSEAAGSGNGTFVLHDGIAICAEQGTELETEMMLDKTAEKEESYLVHSEYSGNNFVVNADQKTELQSEAELYEAAERRSGSCENSQNNLSLNIQRQVEYYKEMKLHPVDKENETHLLCGDLALNAEQRTEMRKEREIYKTAELDLERERDCEGGAIHVETPLLHHVNSGSGMYLSMEQKTESKRGMAFYQPVERVDKTDFLHGENSRNNMTAIAEQKAELEKEMEPDKVAETELEAGGEFREADQRENETYLFHGENSGISFAVNTESKTEPGLEMEFGIPPGADLERGTESCEAAERVCETPLLCVEKSQNNVAVSAEEKIDLERGVELCEAAEARLGREVEPYGAAKTDSGREVELYDKTCLCHVDSSESDVVVSKVEKTELEMEMKLYETVETESGRKVELYDKNHLPHFEDSENNISVSKVEKTELEREMELYEAAEKDDETCLLLSLRPDQVGEPSAQEIDEPSTESKPGDLKRRLEAPLPERRKRGRKAQASFWEDVCFVCFDGGDLILCDRRSCVKAYHVECTGRDLEFFEKKGAWFCGWHFCSHCSRSATMHCYTCPNAVCSNCIKESDFLCIRKNRGLCDACFAIVNMIEHGGTVNADGVQVDFNDVETYEYLYKDYWEDLKNNLSLTWVELEKALSAKEAGEQFVENNFNDLEQVSEGNDGSGVDSDDELVTKRRQQRKRRRSAKASFVEDESESDYNAEGDEDEDNFKSKRGRMKAREFEGWASKELLEFIQSIKEDPKKPLSRIAVNRLLWSHIENNKLQYSRRRGKIICDERLQKLFGKKSVGRFEMMKLLSSHFAPKQASAAKMRDIQATFHDDITEACQSDDKFVKVINEKQRKQRRKLDENKYMKPDPSEYAAINVKNINLIYVRRALLEDLLTDPEFNSKAINAFVRIRVPGIMNKSDACYRLVQVVGIKLLSDPMHAKRMAMTDVVLEILNLQKREEVTIDLVSNQDFTEEECQRLRQCIKYGFIKAMTVGELEEKAKALREVKVKDWFETELLRLGHLRDRASEKGHKKELRECVEKLQLLSNPEERERRLKAPLEIIADPHMDPEFESDAEETPGSDKPVAIYSAEAHNWEKGHGTRSWDKNMASGATEKLSSQWENNSVNEAIQTSAIWDNNRLQSSGWNQKDFVKDKVVDCSEKKNTNWIQTLAVDDKNNPPPIKKDFDFRGWDNNLVRSTEKDSGWNVSFAKKDCIRDGLDRIDNMPKGDGHPIYNSLEAYGGHANTMPTDWRGKRDEMTRAATTVTVCGAGLTAVAAGLTGLQAAVDEKEKTWHYQDPTGKNQGPFSMEQLRKWEKTKLFPLDLKIWKTDHQEESILLTDALVGKFSKNLPYSSFSLPNATDNQSQTGWGITEFGRDQRGGSLASVSGNDWHEKTRAAGQDQNGMEKTSAVLYTTNNSSNTWGDGSWTAGKIPVSISSRPNDDGWNASVASSRNPWGIHVAAESSGISEEGWGPGKVQKPGFWDRPGFAAAGGAQGKPSDDGWNPPNSKTTWGTYGLVENSGITDPSKAQTPGGWDRPVFAAASGAQGKPNDDGWSPPIANSKTIWGVHAATESSGVADTGKAHNPGVWDRPGFVAASGVQGKPNDDGWNPPIANSKITWGVRVAAENSGVAEENWGSGKSQNPGGWDRSAFAAEGGPRVKGPFRANWGRDSSHRDANQFRNDKPGIESRNLRKKDIPCKFFGKGMCKKGPDCIYKHAT